MSQQYPPNQQSWQGQPQQPPPSPGPWQGQPNQDYQQPQYQQQPGQYPPPQPPKKKSRIGLWIALGVIVVVLVLCGVIGTVITRSASTNTGTAVSTSTTTSSNNIPANTPASTASQHFKVGQVVKVGDTWQVTINSVKTSSGEQFLTPTAGNQYVIVDVSLKNLSSQEQTISSALNFSLQDATGQKYDETILTGETPPDGKVEAGSLLRGQMSYEVPTSQKSLTFNFEPDIVAGGQTIWDLHV